MTAADLGPLLVLLVGILCYPILMMGQTPIARVLPSSRRLTRTEREDAQIADLREAYAYGDIDLEQVEEGIDRALAGRKPLVPSADPSIRSTG